MIMVQKAVETLSKYTTLLRYPVEQFLKDGGWEVDESNWHRIYGRLGLGDYPIFDESHRQVLNDKIIRAYYFREIGFETFALFKWHLRRMMHEIMPYYNQLYESEGLVTDPMLSKNLDYTEEWTRDEATDRDTTGNTSATSNSSASDRNVYQDTPMNGLDTGAVESMDYATNVTFDDSTSTSGSTNQSSSKSGYKGDYEGTKKHTQKGFDGSQADLLLTYRKTLINIDLEIVERLDILFMQLW